MWEERGSGPLEVVPFINIDFNVNFMQLLVKVFQAEAEGMLQMARIFFTVFMVDNNTLDILLIKCEPWYVSKHAGHLCSKITSVKSNNSNVSVNKCTAQKKHSSASGMLRARQGLSLQQCMEHARASRGGITYRFAAHLLQGEDCIKGPQKSK